MAFIERKNVQGAVTVRQHHVGSIGEADTKVGITLDDLDNLGHIFFREILQTVRASCDFAEQSQFVPLPHTSQDHIVEFRQYKGGDQERPTGGL